MQNKHIPSIVYHNEQSKSKMHASIKWKYLLFFSQYEETVILIVLTSKNYSYKNTFAIKPENIKNNQMPKIVSYIAFSQWNENPFELRQMQNIILQYKNTVFSIVGKVKKETFSSIKSFIKNSRLIFSRMEDCLGDTKNITKHLWIPSPVDAIIKKYNR